MKYLLSLLFVTLSVTAFAGMDEAIAYNDKIVEEQTKIGKSIMNFSGTPNDETLQGLRDQVKTSLEVLKKMKPYEGNSDLLETAKKLFKFYGETADDEYAKILAMVKNKDKYGQDELTDKLHAFVDAIGKKESPLDDEFQTVQKAFAKKYNFKIVENELQEQIDQAVKQ